MLAWLLLTVVSARAATRSRTHHYAVGGNILYSKRTGYYVLEAAEARVDTARPDAVLGEVSLAKRYLPADWLRIQVATSIGLGVASDDTLMLSTDSYIEKKSMMHIGLEADVHFLSASRGKLTPYLIAGGGVDFMRFQELFYLFDNPSQQVRFQNAAAGWSPSLHVTAGLGTDITLNRDHGLGIAYTFRYWRPIRYDYQRGDMPLKAIPYHERFLTHAFRIAYTFTIRE
jgi:hypothetical protein